ncbi:glycosyltransferase [Liquorilactobacillus vini]|uniref:Glycosyltransferase n=1 Tax=Liquorilactobacillus vini DSM 20605 TaxID=1133569 RepID=A0A0A7RGS7_9LACO|nr:glycosyltransferase family 2 protein [Liquorilactobacillus vini]AJA34462.1 glycosyltransferase [Liquorilactobacillus vini DSM 20605]KRM86270.1 hypothetical protein FD21_GL001720 [Liquorilactobacillus vini DSM 20605]
MKLNLSICLITKNEVANIERCLASIEKIAQEIVVIDTGSTDQTKQLCQQYTNKVFDYQWQDDFAAARNFAISKASHDFIWMLDSDEQVEEIDLHAVNKFIENSDGRTVGRILRKNYTSFNSAKNTQIKTERINRIFPKKYFKYFGRIHEQIVPTDSSVSSNKPIDLPVEIEHFGYQLPAVLTAKAKRDLKLLKLELNDQPNDPYILYQIGKSYNILQENPLAVSYFQKALAAADDPRKDYVYDCVETLGYALNKIHQSKSGIALLNQYPLYQKLADYWFLMGILQMNAALFQPAVSSFLQATKCQHCHTIGCNSFLANYNLGVIYEVLGNQAMARDYYQKCGDYGLAQKGLQRIRKK